MRTMEPHRTRHQPSDTDPWAERMLFDHWRSMKPAEKGELVRKLCRSLLQTHLAGLRSRHPDATEDELRHMAARIRLGDELYEKFIAATRES